MSNTEHRQMVDKIIYGLKVAEREMLEEKARNDEDVIVCGDDNVIRRIPAKIFLNNQEDRNACVGSEAGAFGKQSETKVK